MLTECSPQLAILGGVPSFAEPRHVGAPNIGDRRRLMARLEKMLDARQLSNGGPLVREFEQKVAAVAGTKHCIAMCNGTIALEIGARALALRGEVIVPSYTFVATAHALRWQGITPVFCEIDPLTHNIDPARIEELITPRTTGILAVHLWGRPAPVVALQQIADRHDLRLMFDAAHAFGCADANGPVGGFGDLEVFSFHATKYLNAAEGGAVVTNDDQLALRVRQMHNFGFVGQDEVVALGINGKMTELSAAVGLTSLESIDDFIVHGRRNFAAWQRELDGVPGLSLRTRPERAGNNYQYVVVEIDEAVAGIRRDHLVTALRAENVLARRYFYPGCHRMEPYRTEVPAGGYDLPLTEAVSERVMVLPTGTAVSLADIARMGDLVRLIISQGDEVARHFVQGLVR
jgi:dTDP-4-amino-4,6-dideoxygalactose transaminase